MEQKRRALALAGGGPAVGLSIGALKALKKAGITFDVWSCACIGAWLAVVYNQTDPGKEIDQTVDFFKQVFRPDDEYEKFPIASIFAVDWQTMTRDTIEFVMNPRSYANLVVPESIERATQDLLRLASDPKQWSFANLNSAILNDVLAVNPISRFMTSLMFLSANNGLSRIFYPDSAFLKNINFKRVYEEGKPAIYYNSYNATDKKMELFTNNKKFKHEYGPITAETLCACSALPYIETPVTIGGKTYIEGATIDTVNFEHLLKNHPDLDEVWVSRILDRKQVRPPSNLLDGLNNLIQLFAATTSEDDVKLFLYKLKDLNSKVKVVEIHVSQHVDYNWNWKNLNRGIRDGEAAAEVAIHHYKDNTSPAPSSPGNFWQRSAVPWPSFV